MGHRNREILVLNIKIAVTGASIFLIRYNYIQCIKVIFIYFLINLHNTLMVIEIKWIQIINLDILYST